MSGISFFVVAGRLFENQNGFPICFSDLDEHFTSVSFLLLSAVKCTLAYFETFSKVQMFFGHHVFRFFLLFLAF